MKIKNIIPVALLSTALLVACSGSTAKLNSPEIVSFDVATGAIKFNTVENGETYQATILRRINKATYDSLKANQRTKDMVCTYEIEKEAWYFWNENITSLTMLRDKRELGYIEKSFSLRTYSNSASSTGDPVEFSALAVGDHAVLVLANEVEKYAASDPSFFKFTKEGDLAEPSGFTFSLNSDKKLEVHAANNYFYNALTSTGLPLKLVYEIKNGEEVVETLELEDFSWVNSIQGPTNSFTFNNATLVGNKVYENLDEDTAKGYTLTVKAVGDGDKVKDASSTGSYGQASSGGQGGQGGPGGGGGQGGPGGGGQGNMSVCLADSLTIEKGTATIELPFGWMGSLQDGKYLTGTLKEGTTYVYDLAGTGGMDEEITGTLTLNADGKGTCEVSGFGPISGITVNLTWIEQGDNIVITFDNANSSSNGGEQGGNQGGEQGGNQGGEQGGTDSNWVLTFGTYTYETTEETFEMNCHESNACLQFTATKLATPNAGSDYSFTLAHHDATAPFTFDATLELVTGGVAELHIGAAGPVSEVNQNGTWTLSGTTVTIVLGE